MSAPVRTRRRGTPWDVLVTGAIYLVVGLVTAQMAQGAHAHGGVVAWRLAAWAVSAIVFVTHVGYERIVRASSALATARHAALGAALGACGLAVAATLHHLATGTGNGRLLGLAIVVWPVITAVPAFLVALAGAYVLGRRAPRP
jgi:hypothetical protein